MKNKKRWCINKSSINVNVGKQKGGKKKIYKKKEKKERLMLTLALHNVCVDLVQSAHGDLPDLRVQQKLHQRG